MSDDKYRRSIRHAAAIDRGRHSARNRDMATPTVAEAAAGWRPYDRNTIPCAVDPDHGDGMVEYDDRGFICWDCATTEPA